MRADQLRYEPDRRAPYGYWTCPECADYSGRLIPEHRPDCPIGMAGEGFESGLYHFGPVEVAQIKLVGHSIGRLTFALYCVWRSEGGEHTELGIWMLRWQLETPPESEQ